MIFRDGDQVLMLRRINTGWRDGEYTLPSGHVDGNETIRAAAVRESREEVGVGVNPRDLKFSHVMHRRGDEGDHERVDFFFEVKKFEGKLQNMEPEKCDDLAWFPIDELPDNIIPYVREAIQNSFAGKYFSEYAF